MLSEGQIIAQMEHPNIVPAAVVIVVLAQRLQTRASVAAASETLPTVAQVIETEPPAAATLAPTFTLMPTKPPPLPLLPPRRLTEERPLLPRPGDRP